MGLEKLSTSDELELFSSSERGQYYKNTFETALQQLVDDSTTDVSRFYQPKYGTPWYNKHASFVVVGKDERETAFYITGSRPGGGTRRELRNNGVQLFLIKTRETHEVKKLSDITREVQKRILPGNEERK